MDASPITRFIQYFAFGYPFVMAWYWMAGGILYRVLRGRFEPLFDEPPKLEDTPFVSILVPCHNEEANAVETITALNEIEYPDYEIIAINDGSTDRTEEILEELAARMPRLRVVHLVQNQGKSTALNAGAHLAKAEILVCTDGDALLDRHSVTWLVRRIQGDRRIGAVTGNPRIRNRSTVLGQMQIGEFSSIIGLIKRAQSVYGWLFTVSGVLCGFRRRALAEVGFWSPMTLTDDVEVSWRLQLAGWRIGFEAKAMCWILMPETLRGLWRQRLRWSIGGTQTIIASTRAVLSGKQWSMLVIWANYVISILWAYVAITGVALWLVDLAIVKLGNGFPIMGPIPGWWGGILALTYFCQATLSVVLEKRFEPGILRALFWVVWYPLIFWYLQALTAVVGLPKAIFRPRDVAGTWKSPDRGLR